MKPIYGFDDNYQLARWQAEYDDLPPILRPPTCELKPALSEAEGGTLYRDVEARGGQRRPWVLALVAGLLVAWWLR